LAALLFALPFLLVHSGWRPPADCELLVEMQVGDRPTADSGTIELWVNSTSGLPVRQTSAPGVRRCYRFKLAGHPDIHYLRIDPSNYADVPIRIYGVRIVKGEETRRSFTPRDLAGWRTTCGQSAIQGDALALRAAHSDPLLDANFPSVVLSGGSENALKRYGQSLLIADHDTERIVLLLAVSILVVLGLGLLGGGRTAVAVVAAAIPLTYAALWLVGRLGGRSPSGEAALGYALYSGYPKSLEIGHVPLLLGIPTLVALMGIYVQRCLSRPAVSMGASESVPRVGKARLWIDGLVLGLLTAGLACYFVPDLVSLCPSDASPIRLHWDDNNCLVWKYLFQIGARPFRDFWYPYSGWILTYSPFPHGEIVLALHQFVLFAVFLFAVYLSTEKSLPSTLGIFGPLFGLYAGNYFPSMAPERYGLMVNVILTHVALSRRADRLGWRHVLFWIATVQAAVIEPTGVLYAGVPVFVSLVLDALRAPAVFRAELPGRICREFGPPAAALAAVGVYLALRGELKGFVAFMASLGSQAAYASYPVELQSWLRWASPAESFVLWSVVVLVGVGLERELGEPGPRENAGRVVLLLGVATGMLLLKQFVRPHIAAQIFIVNIAGILFYLFACRKTNAWQWGGAALAAGLLFANLSNSADRKQVWSQLRTAVTRARTSASFLTLKKHEREALVAKQFSAARFQFSDAYGVVFRALIDLSQRGGIQPLYVLSDDPIFYILAGARPYFHINGYNGAPIQEQKRVLRLLEQTPPRVIVWRPGDRGVDCVPPVLRDALVYEHVILNYVPDLSVPPSSFLLLHRRGPEEAVALDFWRTQLGSVLHLGHIPRFSSIARFGSLTDKPGEEVAEFLTVKITSPAALASSAPGVPELPQLGNYHPEGRPLAIPVECAGRRFTLALSIVPGQTEYHVLLNRVWFWGALRKAGLSPTLGDPGPGVETHISRRAMNEDVLY
jgi:hypothetical protein